MADIDITLPVEVKCSICGNDLKIDDTTFNDGYGYGGLSAEINVEPCEACIEKAKDKGAEEERA